MLSVINNQSTIIIKNSKFISLTYQVHSIEEINNILDDVRNKYKDATHVCYAYILDGNIKCSDDGEPSGTAGIPILDVLKKNDLNHVLCIVVRYFGKIKLGAGGLLRAYSNSASLCIKDKIITLKEGYFINIIFSYDNLKLIDNIVKDEKIIDKKYDEKIIYSLNVSKEILDILNNISDIELKINYKTFI